MAVVPRVGQQAKLSVQKDHGVPRLQEVLGGGGAAGAGGEVVDEADGLRFEGDGRAAGSNEDDASGGEVGEVEGDEFADEGRVRVKGLRGRVVSEVGRGGVDGGVWGGRHVGKGFERLGGDTDSKEGGKLDGKAG